MAVSTENRRMGLLQLFIDGIVACHCTEYIPASTIFTYLQNRLCVCFCECKQVLHCMVLTVLYSTAFTYHLLCSVERLSCSTQMRPLHGTAVQSVISNVIFSSLVLAFVSERVRLSLCTRMSNCTNCSLQLSVRSRPFRQSSVLDGILFEH